MKTWMKNNIILTILIATTLAFIISWVIMSVKASTETLPLGYFQKAIFSLMYACVGSLIWPIIMKIQYPKAHNELNELTDGGVNDLPPWERTKVYMWKVTLFIALLIAGIMS